MHLGRHVGEFDDLMMIFTFPSGPADAATPTSCPAATGFCRSCRPATAAATGASPATEPAATTAAATSPAASGGGATPGPNAASSAAHPGRATAASGDYAAAVAELLAPASAEHAHDGRWNAGTGGANVGEHHPGGNSGQDVRHVPAADPAAADPEPAGTAPAVPPGRATHPEPQRNVPDGSAAADDQRGRAGDAVRARWHPEQPARRRPGGADQRPAGVPNPVWAADTGAQRSYPRKLPAEHGPSSAASQRYVPT